MRTAPAILVLLATAVAAAACAKKPGRQSGAGAEPGLQTDETQTSGVGTLPFALPRAEARTVPFRLLLRKLADVVGKPATDPVFAPLRAARFELGDYEHLAAVGGDAAWGAGRREAWTAAMLELCGTALMRSRYPGKDGALTLLETAFDRRASDDDAAAIDGWLKTPGLAPERAETLACAGILASTEFVAGDRLPALFVQRALERDELKAWTADPRRVIRGWRGEAGIGEAARVFVQTLIGVSGKAGDLNADLAGNLAARIAVENRPWSELLTAADCVSDDGDAMACDTGAPFAAGILTTRGFLKGKTGRFNLHRAGTVLTALACKQFPLDDDLEPRAAMDDLIPMFGREDSGGEQFGNGTKCYSCHGQFSLHAQLYVKFDDTGRYVAGATGAQDASKQAGESANGLYASHFKDPARARDESARYLGKDVANLGDAARELATSPLFLRCTIERLLDFGFGLAGTENEKPDAAFVDAVATRLESDTPDPTFLDIVEGAFGEAAVKAAAGNE